MASDHQISNHYQHGDLIRAIVSALKTRGLSPDTVTIEELAAVDEFHIGGRWATDHLIAQLNIHHSYRLIDIGCGLGGASRYIASRYCRSVTGIDLTAEYVETGNVLTDWVRLYDRVNLEQGSALLMPYLNDEFDAGYMLHVGMNIEDKVALFAEVFRVLKAGACFGVYDVMRQNENELVYPVPWANDKSASFLATPAQYKDALTLAGFKITAENNRLDFAIDFFNRLRAKSEKVKNPPALGIHTLLGKSATKKINNLVTNLAANCIAPVELIAVKPG